MTDDKPETPAPQSNATGAMLGSENCWHCRAPRDLFGDGSRSCSNCGAGELGWTDSW